ncbi:MAG: apbE [Chlamydiia bacterium]|nr:apbE [Chlamydiia bacterium]
MTVPYRIEIGKNLSTTKQAEVQNTIDATFNEIDRVYNKWNKNSELSKLNRLPANQPESISNELAHFLRRCDYFVKLSKGKFDPTIEALQQVWKDHLEKGTLPSENEIKIAQATVGWDTITLKNNVFTKKHSATALDLGGIAKGYTVDLMVERLQKMGYNSVFVEWGGEIRASGKHPQGRSWAVYISNLEDLNPEHALAYVPLTNQAIATSGDYLQNWIVDGTTYFHVFDPQTGKPLALTDTSIASASCLANDCMTADALATMLVMCKTLDEAKALATELQTEIPGTVFWLMSRKKNDK